jgi:cysteine sulfinate desulfinase/cysteine desulfurase-like protein
MQHITNEQLAVMIEESNKHNNKMLIALYGDEEEQGLIKDVKELKEIVTTTRTLWDAVKIIGSWIIKIAAVSAAVLYIKHLYQDTITTK